MKTRFQTIHSLSRHLHDSEHISLGNKRFGSEDNGLSTQLQQEVDCFIVSVPVPGLSKEDLSVYMDDRVLFITKKRQAKLFEQPSGLTQDVKYSFVFPDGIDTDRIEAKCRDGMLTIKLRKTQSKKHHNVIEVLGDENGNDSGPLNKFWNKIKAKIDVPKFSQRRQLKVSRSAMPMNS